MSTIVDEPTYPYSRKLVEAINQVIPNAKARSARAKNFKRVHNLFKTKQMQLVLLSKSNANALIEGSGPFLGYGPIEASILYAFGDLFLLVQNDFPDSNVWVLADAFKKIHNHLPDALTTEEFSSEGTDTDAENEEANCWKTMESPSNGRRKMKDDIIR